ncbi:MAG: hypothetical protein E6G94_07660 [Alphaproteobacteria bacterium]|nr:MAG: hypothetical protein E6G94_07660 [Alphaproteobacteria bacterium]
MIGRKQRFTLIAAAAFAAGVTAWACADPSEPPNWEVAKDNYDAGGSSAVLTPGNDTRVNLLLLLADRHGKPPRLAGATQEGLPPILFPWSVMFAATEPARPESEQWQEWSPTRCQSNAGGGAAFVAAVRADGQVPEAEKARLVAARTAFVPDCSGQGAASPAVAAASPAGRAFADYLTAAADFYGERFAPARATFAALAKAQDPWLRETALYMVARTELNRALAGSFEEYGSLAPPEKRDNAAIAAAREGFQAYLKAYPKGRYAPSARGLTRRVAWLAGDEPALAAAFDREVAAPEAYDGAPSPAQLAQEIDTTLLIPGSGTAARDPLLVAVADLSRMRCPVEGDSTDGSCAHLGTARLIMAATRQRRCWL